MAAATVSAAFFGGASTEGAGSTAVEAGCKFNRADSITDTTPIAIPTATGTNYSWYKPLGLLVTSTGTTNIDNRNVYMSSACPAGLELFFGTSSAYVQASSANRPADTTSADAADPAGYTAITTAAQAYSTESVATSTGRNGVYFCKVLLGVSSTGTYTGGPGSAIVLPSLVLVYDEA